MKSMLLSWGRFVVTASLLVPCAGYAVQQQAAPAAPGPAEADKFQTAANKWMTVPVDVRAENDPIPPQDRNARDGYWDGLIGASAPLSDPNAQGHPMPIADAVPDAPEFSDLGDGVMAIAKFESYRTVLSNSQRSVYTEIGLRVLHIFGNPNAPIQAGQLIELARPGGTIIAPWGKTLSYGIYPEQLGLQPQHTYLIRLGYHPSGHFYTAGYRTGELWDLTDGSVKPGNSLQKFRAEHSLSQINGMSTDALIQFLDKKYEEYYRGGR